jgi:hypothetical protein
VAMLLVAERVVCSIVAAPSASPAPVTASGDRQQAPFPASGLSDKLVG